VFYVYSVILAELPEINLMMMMMIVMEGSNVNISQQQQQQRRYNCVTKDGSISLLICGIQIQIQIQIRTCRARLTKLSRGANKMCNFYVRDRLMMSLQRNTNNLRQHKSI